MNSQTNNVLNKVIAPESPLNDEDTKILIEALEAAALALMEKANEA